MKQKKERRGSYVILGSELLNAPAWRTLDPYAKAVYPYIKIRYRGSTVSFSAREAAAVLGICRGAASLKLKDLVEKGFMVTTVAGGFNRKRHATEYRLTELPCDGAEATFDFRISSENVVHLELPHRKRGAK